MSKQCALQGQNRVTKSVIHGGNPFNEGSSVDEGSVKYLDNLSPSC
jgi:hypothetical protein